MRPTRATVRSDSDRWSGAFQVLKMKRPAERRAHSFLAGGLGFEPRLTESESDGDPGRGRVSGRPGRDFSLVDRTALFHRPYTEPEGCKHALLVECPNPLNGLRASRPTPFRTARRTGSCRPGGSALPHASRAPQTPQVRDRMSPPRLGPGKPRTWETAEWLIPRMLKADVARLGSTQSGHSTHQFTKISGSK
jgi:hypothetical protein